MKRGVVVLLGLVVAGAAVWGFATHGAELRWYLRVRWRAIQASGREPAALEAWRKQFGDPETPAAPSAHDNAAALRLVELGPAVGVNIRESGEPSLPSSLIHRYVETESLKTSGPVGAPPEAVRSYLDTHETAIGAVVALLAQAEPAWKTEAWLEPSSATSGHLFALETLNRVLIAEALAQSARGRDADGERALLASWNLNASLNDRLGIAEQLIVAEATSVQARIARRLTLDPGPWRARLGEHDYRASLLRANVVRASHQFSLDRSQMARASRADYLDLMRANLTQLRDLPVTGPPVAWINPDEAIREGWSTGATLAETMRPQLRAEWISMDRVMLQLELTDRVLHARQLKAQLGKWPATIPDIEASRIAGAHWVYGVDTDHQMSIAINPTLQGPPLRFESRDR